MTGYEICAAAMMLGGLLPALVLASRGRPVERIIGLVLAGTVITLVMVLMGQITGQSYDLIDPIVLAVLSVVGTLVFTRLIPGVEDGP